MAIHVLHRPHPDLDRLHLRLHLDLGSVRSVLSSILGVALRAAFFVMFVLLPSDQGGAHA